MNDPVVVHFQLTEVDTARAFRGRVLRNPRFYGFEGLGILLVGISFPLGHQFGVVIFLLGLLLILVSLSLLGAVQKGAWRKNPALRGPTSMAFYETGVRARTVNGESSLRWDAYPETIENGAYYMLHRPERGGYTIVPKRAFSSAQDELAFRSLVERHTEARLRPSQSHTDHQTS
jgi:hypothetical protein